MKNPLNTLCSLGLVLALLSPPVYGRESSPERQADLLAAQWDALAADANLKLKNAGYLGIAMGIPLAIGGSILWGSSSGNSALTGGVVGVGVGVGMALGGALSLLVETPYTKSAKDTFPAGLSGQARLDAYEKAFQSLAEEERGNRRFFAVVSGVMGLGATALFIPALGSSRDSTTGLLAVLGPALIAGAVFVYLTPDIFESRWLSYKKSGQISFHRPTGPSLKLGVTPISGGGMAIAALRF
jgi:predicted phage tail protein